MKVLTFDEEKFRKECRRLSEMVVAGAMAPRIVVGIAKGGAVVMRAMQASLRELLPDPPVFYEVSSHRPSTASKEHRLKRVIRILPRPLANLLRILEHTAGGMKGFRAPQNVPVSPELTSSLRALDKNAQVLVVDDALDSGATMRDVLRALFDIRPDLDIRTAVIASTRSRQAVKADFSLYGTNILIRFPWSLDA